MLVSNKSILVSPNSVHSKLAISAVYYLLLNSDSPGLVNYLTAVHYE
jgi:hypothetical protein